MNSTTHPVLNSIEYRIVGDRIMDEYYAKQKENERLGIKPKVTRFTLVNGSKSVTFDVRKPELVIVRTKNHMIKGRNVVTVNMATEAARVEYRKLLLAGWERW